MEAVEVVRALARALDADDFDHAAALLDADCTYDTGRAILHGPSAIVASYREASDWGRTHLDSVRFESRIEDPVGDEVGIVYTDHLEHRGRPHVHRCRQVVRVGPHGRVTRITHHDLPGEVEALRAYFAACGLER